MYLRSQWGYLGGPKIVSIPYPCCDPSAAELTSRTLGPVQTLYESLNRFISLGVTITLTGHSSVRAVKESRAGASTIAGVT
jgi:hypothetical protein